MLTEDEAAQRGYERWSGVLPARPISLYNVMEDYYGAGQDLGADPAGFPVRLRGRLGQYTTRGPDINEPGFTYPYSGSEITDYRMALDQERAAQAVTPPKPRRRR